MKKREEIKITKEGLAKFLLTIFLAAVFSLYHYVITYHDYECEEYEVLLPYLFFSAHPYHFPLAFSFLSTPPPPFLLYAKKNREEGRGRGGKGGREGGRREGGNNSEDSEGGGEGGREILFSFIPC